MTNPENFEELPEEVVVSGSIPVPEAEPGDIVVTEAVATPVVPTQMVEKARATWRTAATALIVGLPVVNLAMLAFVSILSDYGYTADNLPAWFWAGVNGAVIVSGIGAKWLNSIMLLPNVNEWLTKHNLGPTPPKQIKES